MKMLIPFFTILSLFELTTTAWGWVDANKLFRIGEVEKLSKIGDFQVVDFLGKGSQGSAYEVLDLHTSNQTNLTNLTNSIYALKLVSNQILFKLCVLPTQSEIKCIQKSLQKAKSPHLISIKEVLDESG